MSGHSGKILLIIVLISAISIFGNCYSDKGAGSEPPTDTLLTDTIYRRDFAYAEGRIYDLFYPEDSIGLHDRIIDMRMYESRPNARPEEMLTGRWSRLVLRPDTAGEAEDSPFDVTILTWEIDRNLYSYLDDAATNQHYVVFNSAHSQYDLGVWMKVERRDAADHPFDTIEYGNITLDTILLKMLHPMSGYSPSHPAWRLMWRNVYAVPRGNIVGDLHIRVFKAAIGEEGTPQASEEQRVGTVTQGKYIRILGLDQYNEVGRKLPDDEVDDRYEIYAPDWGLLIFPSREPFNSDTQFVSEDNVWAAPLETRSPQLYRYTSNKERVDASAYYIEYLYSWRPRDIY